MHGRLFFLGLAFLGALSSHPIEARGDDQPLWLAHEAKLLDCHVKDGLVEGYVCPNPSLLAQDKALTAAYRQLRAKLKGDLRRALVIQQTSWAWHRGICMDEHAKPPVDHVRCFAEQYRARQAILEAQSKDPSLIEAQAGDFDTSNPWYVDRFARQFEGRKVYLRSTVEPLNCKGPLEHVRVRFSEDGSWIAGEINLVDESRLAFLCEKPSSLWDGIVRLDAKGKPVLYRTE